ncbi:hypothetical protein TRIUR3_29485 [Triticum urartu]|uniref:Uncharacterized protein n=1 Tax=Triticum urartu TaxID=4572 RepID=M7YXK0_TRIUA|nr:hypothetical protein TRIUR3_29485 [Triticum urartu]
MESPSLYGCRGLKEVEELQFDPKDGIAFFKIKLLVRIASCLAHTTNEGFGTPFSNSISESNTPISLNSNPVLFVVSDIAEAE